MGQNILDVLLSHFPSDPFELIRTDHWVHDDNHNFNANIITFFVLLKVFEELSRRTQFEEFKAKPLFKGIKIFPAYFSHFILLPLHLCILERQPDIGHELEHIVILLFGYFNNLRPSPIPLWNILLRSFALRSFALGHFTWGNIFLKMLRDFVWGFFWGGEGGGEGGLFGCAEEQGQGG